MITGFNQGVMKVKSNVGETDNLVRSGEIDGGGREPHEA